MADRSSQQRFLVRAVDVDKAILGVRVRLLHPLEPKNARKNEVFSPSLRRDLAGGNAAFEDHAHGSSRTDFLPDRKRPERRLVASDVKAEAELGSRNRIGLEQPAFLEQIQSLTQGVDPKLQWNVDNSRRDVYH